MSIGLLGFLWGIAAFVFSYWLQLALQGDSISFFEAQPALPGSSLPNPSRSKVRKSAHREQTKRTIVNAQNGAS